MLNSNKKYIILAILGALIISAATYLLINIYLEKAEIIVFKNDVLKGQIIKENDLGTGYYYRNSLPHDYIKTSSEIIGKKLNIDRLKGDYITYEMTSELKENNPYKNLKDEEIILSINLGDKEKISSELLEGEKIIIVSTEKDKELYELFLNSIKNLDEDILNSDKKNDLNYFLPDNKELNSNSPKTYLNSSIVKISENILLVDGYLLFKNIEIVKIISSEDASKNILLNSNFSKSMLVKCNIYEASYLAKITSENNYKILVGKNNV